MKDQKAQITRALRSYLLLLLVVTVLLAIRSLVVGKSSWSAFGGGLLSFVVPWSLPLIFGGKILVYRKVTRADEKPAPPHSADVAPFVVHVHWFMQGVLFLVAIVALAGAFGSITRPTAVTLFVTPAAIGVAWYMWALARSTIRVTSQSISITGPHGRFRIDWEEVTRIITDGASFSFQNEHKNLSVSLTYAGSGSLAFFQYVNYQVERRPITVEYSRRIPLTHRNAREK